MGQTSSTPKPWYKTWWGIILLILFLPLWPFLLTFWVLKRQGWNKKVKLIAIGAIWLVASGFYGPFSIMNSSYRTNYRGPSREIEKQVTIPPTTVPDQQSNKEPEKPQVSQEVAAPVQPTKTEVVTSYNIQVTSQIVKKVGSKYRYFFDIRNKDTRSFEGRVSIQLFNSLFKSSVWSDTFATTRPIEQNLGTSVYTDANTGPEEVHGEAGLSKFTFEVFDKNKNSVARGEGIITTEFEDTSTY